MRFWSENFTRGTQRWIIWQQFVCFAFVTLYFYVTIFLGKKKLILTRCIFLPSLRNRPTCAFLIGGFYARHSDRHTTLNYLTAVCLLCFCFFVSLYWYLLGEREIDFNKLHSSFFSLESSNLCVSDWRILRGATICMLWFCFSVFFFFCIDNFWGRRNWFQQTVCFFLFFRYLLRSLLATQWKDWRHFVFPLTVTLKKSAFILFPFTMFY